MLCKTHARTLHISSCYAAVELLDQDVALLYLELITSPHGRATFILPAEVIEIYIYIYIYICHVNIPFQRFLLLFYILRNGWVVRK